MGAKLFLLRAYPQRKREAKMEATELLPLKVYPFTLTLLYSERPKLYIILAFLSAIGLISQAKPFSFKLFSKTI